MPLIDPRKSWKRAQLVERELIASNMERLVFDVDDWFPHQPGQHVDVRLTAPDGYRAERSYSLASPYANKRIELGIELLPHGEVSPYLFNLPVGESIEIRGPIGNHFIWNESIPGPLILVAGGSGVVPFMSMLRHHFFSRKNSRDIVLILSSRNQERLPYNDELKQYAREEKLFSYTTTFTDNPPRGWGGYSRRIDREMIDSVLGDRNTEGSCFVCGPTGFVEVVAGLLMARGYPHQNIKTERFGGA